MGNSPYFGFGIDRLTGACVPQDSNFPGGDFADYYGYISQQRLEELRKTGQFGVSESEWPASAIEYATIRTTYIPIYRIQSKDYFAWGHDFPSNWVPSERKANRADRYSPPSTAGFYFGLTLKAAEDEARYYGKDTLNPEEQMILVMEACFDNILYLPAALHAVWEIADLPKNTSISEMFLQIMDPKTDNEVTNHIGRWARDVGVNGLLYPTARYGRDDWLKPHRRKGVLFYPAINFVNVGSHLCRNDVRQLPSVHAVNDLLRNAWEEGKEAVPVFAEMNIVLFEGTQLSGEVRGVIYQTFPLNMRDDVLAQDDAQRQSMSYTLFAAPYWPEGFGDP
jgi:RES domain